MTNVASTFLQSNAAHYMVFTFTVGATNFQGMDFHGGGRGKGLQPLYQQDWTIGARGSGWIGGKILEDSTFVGALHAPWSWDDWFLAFEDTPVPAIIIIFSSPDAHEDSLPMLPLPFLWHDTEQSGFAPPPPAVNPSSPDPQEESLNFLPIWKHDEVEQSGFPPIPPLVISGVEDDVLRLAPAYLSQDADNSTFGPILSGLDVQDEQLQSHPTYIIHENDEAGFAPIPPLVISGIEDDALRAASVYVSHDSDESTFLLVPGSDSQDESLRNLPTSVWADMDSTGFVPGVILFPPMGDEDSQQWLFSAVSLVGLVAMDESGFFTVPTPSPAPKGRSARYGLAFPSFR